MVPDPDCLVTDVCQARFLTKAVPLQEVRYANTGSIDNNRRPLCGTGGKVRTPDIPVALKLKLQQPCRVSLQTRQFLLPSKIEKSCAYGRVHEDRRWRRRPTQASEGMPTPQAAVSMHSGLSGPVPPVLDIGRLTVDLPAVRCYCRLPPPPHKAGPNVFTVTGDSSRRRGHQQETPIELPEDNTNLQDRLGRTTFLTTAGILGNSYKAGLAVVYRWLTSRHSSWNNSDDIIDSDNTVINGQPATTHATGDMCMLHHELDSELHFP
ncbi:hypothetical protein J6590_039483 [Homalodisca vitripennis]|nr:hypothetical protein J6590_039483 [Homalodisca vitripennis]